MSRSRNNNAQKQPYNPKNPLAGVYSPKVTHTPLQYPPPPPPPMEASKAIVTSAKSKILN